MKVNNEVAAKRVLSLTKSANLEDEVQQLRLVLRSAFLNEGRRQEVQIYEAVCRFVAFAKQWVEASDANESIDEDARFALTRYLQDMFAALLFLIDEESLANSYNIEHPPSNDGNRASDVHVSEFYVSAHQRAYCAHWFFFLSARMPTSQVIQSLYPLLDSPLTGSDSSPVSAPLQNHIAPGLLRRQQSKRRLLSHVLNGVFLSHVNGVQGLLQALLLGSDVPNDLVFEASQHMVALVTAPMNTVWLVQAGGAKTVDMVKIGSDSRIALISSQLLPLFVCHAEENGSSDTAQALSAGPHPRLPPHTTLSTELPPETVESRLHLFLTMLSNAFVRLPRVDVNSVVYRHAYRDFFFFTKYFLTPAFSALSLRRKPPVDTNDIVASVFRLHTIADGATLGVSAQSFLTVFDTVAAGFLNLTALKGQHRNAALDVGIARLWECIHQLDTCAEEIASALVRSTLTPHRYCFVVTDRVAGSIDYIEQGSSSSPGAALEAMLLAIFGTDATLQKPSTTLQSRVVRAMAVECRSALYGVSLLPEWSATADQITSSDLPCDVGSAEVADDTDRSTLLLSAIEKVCMTSSSDAIFGTDATLVSIFELLTTTLPLSDLCFQWSVEMAANVATSTALLTPFLQGPHEEGHLRKKAPRLTRVLREFVALAHHLSKTRFVGEASQLTAVASVDDAVAVLLEKLEESAVSLAMQTHGSAGLVQEVRLRWESLTATMASALETQAQATLSVALMGLAASVEDAAYSIQAADRAALESTTHALVAVLMQVLVRSGDVCACGHAVRALVWVGMYRFDAADSGFLAETVCGALLASASGTDPSSPTQTHPVQVRAARVAGGGHATADPVVSALEARVASASREQIGRFKCRVLDIILSWCDYDQEGRTLRNIDDACRHSRGISLFDVLRCQCHEDQLPVVQVAALHCLGYYVGAVYPRVSLSYVCQLCKDVFRHTRVEMAKAACAAMLRQIATTLKEQGTLSAIADVDLEEVLAIANAMTSYNLSRTRPADAMTSREDGEPSEHALHGEVIRENGRHVVALLGATANGLFVQELHAS